MSEHYKWTAPKARKACPCDICGRIIQTGEKYARCDGLHGVIGVSVWRECNHCQAMVRAYEDIQDPHEPSRPGPDDVGEWSPETVTALRHKVYWSKRWTRNDGTLYPIPETETP